MTSKVYLAARYSRFVEMQGYAATLEHLGFEVTSRWIKGDHKISDEQLEDTAHELIRQRFALEDYEDLMKADICISFTEEPRTSSSRGGRHVEFGIAIANSKRCIVVGHRENVFHCLPQVEFFDCWELARDRITFGEDV